MISEETRDNLRFILSHPKDVICDFLEFLRSRQGAERHAESRMLRNFVLSLPESEAMKYREEIDCLRGCDQGGLVSSVFPYPVVKPRGDAKTGYDGRIGLPYVIHKDRRLYYPRGCEEATLGKMYLYFLEVEGLTGAGCLKKSPHSYVADDFCVEEGDVLVDVGCSEALFTLDNIEKVSRAYVFETIKRWKDPLRATFSPYAEKVTIINKFVGGETRGHVIRLDDALPKDSPSTCFIKMDIEGGELDVLKNSEAFLKNHKVKLACCLYHRQDDETRIIPFLRKLGFSVRISDGYMLPTSGGVSYPYFRRGVAYAKNY